MRRSQHRIQPGFGRSTATPDHPCPPRYEWHERAGQLDIEVFVPGVEAAAVEMTIDGGDLLITAHRQVPVLANWQSANLGAARSDYWLRLPLPQGVNPRRIRGEFDRGVLTVHLGRGGPQPAPPVGRT